MNSVSLADQRVWIIDDEIPVSAWEYGEELLKGNHPIDRGALLTLVRSEELWDDDPLRLLCEQLVREAGDVTAFTHPGPAVQYLDSGGVVPDIVVFDLDYRTSRIGALSSFEGLGTNDPLELLERMLMQCVSVVQVYTDADVEDAARRLEPLQGKYHKRLKGPQNKLGTNAEQLVGIMRERLKDSLSARLAKRVRHSSSSAIEDVLNRIDSLPLDVAVGLLAGSAEIPGELELVEFLSTKMGEALEGASGLVKALKEFMVEKGITIGQAEETVNEIVALLASNVREHILYDGRLFDEIRSAWKAAEGTGGTETDSIKRIIREFSSFRLYDCPQDDLVRTGDIVYLSPDKNAREDKPSQLHLVLTPPCDLAHFWYNTRGILTLAKMHLYAENKGAEKIKTYEHSKLRCSSITVGNPIILPAVPLDDKGGWSDYLLFVHEIEFKEFQGGSLAEHIGSRKGKKQRFSQPVTYQELRSLDGELERKCRVSEPFLSGILAKMSDQLFRTGVPDLHKTEQDRLKGFMG